MGIRGVAVKNFSTSAFRSFKKFIGELTATAAGIHVGVLEALPVVEKLDQKDPWETAALKHGIMLRGLKSERIVTSSNRLNLVSLYSGFDLFLLDIRSQFYILHGKAWKQEDKDTPFGALVRNSPSSKCVHEEKLGLHRIATLDYYRLVRNAVAHPEDEATKSAKKFYDNNALLLTKARNEYGMQSAPNSFENLNFHDVKFLACVALYLAAAIDEDFDPGDDRIAKLLPVDILKRQKSSERNHNAIKGWLSVTYGISPARAERIINIHKTH